jgi:type I restriction enzyme S subunit
MATAIQSWPWTPLGEVLIERKEIPSLVELASGTVRIVAKIGFNDGMIQLRPDSNTRTGMILARPGDVIVSGINAVKGAVAIYGEGNIEPVAATIHYGAYAPKKDRVDVQFLWWLLRSQVFREILNTNLPGGIKTELKAKRFLPIKVPLPPLNEQRRIVSRIEKLAAHVNEAQHLRLKSNSETETFFMKLLGQTFEKLKEHSTTIGAAFRVTTGGTPSRHIPQYWQGDVKWVSSGEVAFCRITETTEKITEQGTANSNAKIYPPNTVLLAMIGQGKTRGQCAILDCHASTNQNVAAIHVYETPHSPDFVYWWLFSRYQASRFTETGTAQPALSGERVKQMPIPLPSPSIQAQVVSHLNTLKANIDALRKLQIQTAAELDALMPSILSRAFRGEL